MITLIAKLLKILNSEAEAGQISLAFCFAMVIGLTPLWSLHNLLVLLLVLVLKVNLSGFLLGWGVFSAGAYLLDPLFHRIGYSLLTASGLTGLWTSLYNVAWLRFENFNNTVVLGSLVISLLLFVPLLIISNLLIKKYRDHVLAWTQKMKLNQVLKSSKLYNIYQELS